MSTFFHVRLSLRIYNVSRSHFLLGTSEVELPFVPAIGMTLEFKEMYPLEIISVKWQSEEERFYCAIEDTYRHEFDSESDASELMELVDTLRLAKQYGWEGLDKIYRNY